MTALTVGLDRFILKNSKIGNLRQTFINYVRMMYQSEQIIKEFEKRVDRDGVISRVVCCKGVQGVRGVLVRLISVKSNIR